MGLREELLAAGERGLAGRTVVAPTAARTASPGTPSDGERIPADVVRASGLHLLDLALDWDTDLVFDLLQSLRPRPGVVRIAAKHEASIGDV